MTKCWNKDISVRPSMEEVATQMSFLSQFFPGSTEPIKFLEIGQTFDFNFEYFMTDTDILDGDRDTIGSESVVSFDTAEQSFVSQSEVGEVVSVTSELAVSEDNPESLALAVHNNNTNNLRLEIQTNNPA